MFRKLNSSSLDNGETDEPESGTEVRFVSFLSGKFTTIAVINLPKRKPTFVHWADKFTG